MTRRRTPALLPPRRAARASAAVAAAALLLVASPALAQDGQARPPVVLASFAGQLPGDLAALPERLTGAMADIVRDAGSKVTRAPLGDLLAVAGCAEASDDCLQQARALLEVGRVVAGDVEPAGSGRVRVSLRLIAARQKARRRALLLAGGNAAALEADFRARAAAFWRDPDAASATSRSPKRPSGLAPASASDTSAASDTPAGGADLVASGDAPEAGFSARRVDPLAWGVAGGGAGLAVVGGLLLLVAADKQDQVNDAPTETAADLDALVELEESGRTYARWGSVLTVVGAVTAAAGAALVFKQGSEAARDDGATGGALTLSPSLFPGGAGAVLTWRAGR